MPSEFPLWYRQPFKGLYIFSRLFSLLALVPSWVIYYSLFSRPRASWTLKESVAVRVIRWIMPLNATCGISPLATDKTREVPESELKETSFVWIEPAENSLIREPAEDANVPAVRIPGYIWPKGGKLGEDGGLVGLFIHGGGYMMGNGSETFPETCIAREIFNLSKIKSILSVDYRLVHEACHPGQLLDALAAYSHLINLGINSSRIVIIGACAGGHLALMLTRYLYKEKVLSLPVGLMLFSPWVDMVLDEKIQEDQSKARPNTNIDMLSTSFLANLLFLGHHPRTLLSSPLLSANLAPIGSYVKYPPTFISVGGCESFKRECAELESLMHSDGVDVVLDVQEDAVHDFWGFGDIVPSAKARHQLAERVVKWVAELSS